MKKILFFLRDHLEITTREAKSTLAFLASALLSLGIYFSIDFSTRSKYARYTVTKYAAESPVMSEEVTEPAPKFRFDPNTASRDELLRLGIAPRVASTILNYREKGGKFRYREDLRKMYSLKPEVYAGLEAWIDLPEKPASSPVQRKKTKSPPPKAPAQSITFDINTADTTQLKQLKGIGPAFSARIVRFRDALGGFHSLEQLDETYGISPEALAALKKAAFIGSPVKTIPVNTAEVFRHPYIKPYQVKALLEYRKQHGPFHSIADLRKIKLLDEETIQKMAPYLSF